MCTIGCHRDSREGPKNDMNNNNENNMEGVEEQEADDVMKKPLEGEDGFSFRPQREKTGERLHQFSPSRSHYRPHPKRFRREHERSRGLLGTEGNRFPLLDCTDFIQAQTAVENHFNKRYAFTRPTHSDGEPGWQLPPAETMYTKPEWRDEELQAMKVSLNETKQLLSDKDVANWQRHTNTTNPTQNISHAVKRRAQPEMVTQAWLKFYEIVNAYPIVPLDDGAARLDPDFDEPDEDANTDEDQAFARRKPSVPFNSVHLCEAPGAFILALNHFLAINRSSFKWQWLGNTLNPYYESTPKDSVVTDDRLIYLTLKNWMFGRDSTGDLMVWDNICDILHKAQLLGPIHLVTADGSFDCQANPSEQERSTHSLHLCEVLVALSLLAPGGSLVVKKFTFFENETVNLMFVLCCVFEQVHVYKPGTSKEGNSEVYVVAINYSGKDKYSSHLKVLLEMFRSKANSHSMFANEDIPEDFMRQIRECAERFKVYQSNAIARNVVLYQGMSEHEKQFNELLKKRANTLFFDRNYCVSIYRSQTLTDGLVNKGRNLQETDLSKVESAILKRAKCVKYKLKLLMDYIQKVKENYWYAKPDNLKSDEDGSRSTVSFVSPCFETIEFEVIRGKPLISVINSKFCSGKVMRIYLELYHLCEKSNTTGDSKDEVAVSDVFKEHSGARVVRGEAALNLHAGCWAQEQALMLLEEGSIPDGGSLVLTNMLLLSRLQYGLLVLLGSAFERVQVLTAGDLGTRMPAVVLEGLKSVGLGKAVVSALRRIGWSPDEGKGGTQVLLQVVKLQTLMQSERLQAVYHYNAHYCSYNASTLYKNAEVDLDSKHS